jgi:hypothetical protein
MRKPMQDTQQQDALRFEIGRSANFEVEQMAGALMKIVSDHDDGSELSVIARGMLMRISNLSDIVFEAVFQDESERDSVSDLQRKLGQDMALPAASKQMEASHD